MSELQVVLSAAGLFIVRIGIPVMVLVALGVLIDRWQTHREAEAMAVQQPATQAATESDSKHKAA